MGWRYIIISNFTTIDNRSPGAEPNEQLDAIFNHETGISDDTFCACVNDFIERRNATGFGTISQHYESKNNKRKTIILDGATKDDLRALRTEFGEKFSIAAIGVQDLERFLQFQQNRKHDEPLPQSAETIPTLN